MKNRLELELEIVSLKGAVLTLSDIILDLISSANNYSKKRIDLMQKFINEIKQLDKIIDGK